MTTVNIADGKRDFSRLIQQSIESSEEIIVTRRGRPMAVIISYDQFQQLRRADGYRRIIEARQRFAAQGIQAEDVYAAAKADLEKRP
jgi:prevent-host-death family protein